MASPERMSLDQLPGGDLVDLGVTDLQAGRDTAAAALVSMARSRLRDVGIDVPDAERPGPAGHRLYGLLAEDDRATAHSTYNAYVGRLVSFIQAAERAPAR